MISQIGEDNRMMAEQLEGLRRVQGGGEEEPSKYEALLQKYRDIGALEEEEQVVRRSKGPYKSILKRMGDSR